MVSKSVPFPMIVVLSAAMTFAGCSSSKSIPISSEQPRSTVAEKQNGKFSGRFLVHSQFPETIVIKKWDGFDFVSPSDGTIIPNSGSGTEFPSLDQFPATTTVKWEIEGSKEMRSQTIDLNGIVPPDANGTTRFDLSADGKWTARFVPGDD